MRGREGRAFRPVARLFYLHAYNVLRACRRIGAKPDAFDLFKRIDYALGKAKPDGKLDLAAGRAHEHRVGRPVNAYLQGLLDNDEDVLFDARPVLRKGGGLYAEVVFLS